MKIEAKKRIYLGESGIMSKVTFPTVETPYGELRLVVGVFISDTGNLSISGESYMNGRVWAFGQNMDDLRLLADHCGDETLRNDALWILRMWELYHLNDMKPGTPEQHAALSDMRPFKYPESWYDVACEHLKAKGLYEVYLNGKVYRFGQGWITHPIPQDDLKKIREYFSPDMV